MPANSAHQMDLPFAPPRPGGPSRTGLLRLALEEGVGPVSRLVLNDNRHHLISVAFDEGAAVVRIHQMFLDAPGEVRVALSRYLKTGHRPSARLLDTFIDANEHLLRAEAVPLPANAHQGKVHDLLPIFHQINHAYFEGQIEAELTWGQAGSFRGKRRRSIKLGSYDHHARRITIHPALDQVEVPDFCVARVVHHEMLHQKHPMKKDAAGRRIMHPPIFRKDEALFAQAAQADAWLDANLDLVLGFKTRPTKKRRPSAQPKKPVGVWP